MVKKIRAADFVKSNINSIVTFILSDSLENYLLNKV